VPRVDEMPALLSRLLEHFAWPVIPHILIEMEKYALLQIRREGLSVDNEHVCMIQAVEMLRNKIRELAQAHEIEKDPFDVEGFK